jgi:hypothetical protein
MPDEDPKPLAHAMVVIERLRCWLTRGPGALKCRGTYGDSAWSSVSRVRAAVASQTGSGAFNADFMGINRLFHGDEVCQAVKSVA